MGCMPFLTSLATAVVLLLALFACKQAPVSKPKADSGPVQVQVASVSTRQIQRIVDSVGTLFPFDEVIVSAEIEGKVDQVNYDLGDTVKTGEVLVHISDEEQRYILLQNEAQLHQSLERLGLRNEGDKVKDINETPEVRRSAADLREAQQRYSRLRSLVDQKIGAQADLDAASSRFQAMQAALDLTRNQTRNLISEVERFKAIVDLQRKKLRDTSVRAPFLASVKERTVSLGQYVRPNTPLFTLVKTSQLRLRLEVPERLAPWTKVGQTAEVIVEAYAGRTFRGSVWRIAPVVEQSKRTFVTEVLIENPDGALKPGSYARARLATQKSDDIMLVPVKAVAYVLGANKAFVVGSNGVVEAREVKLGDRFNEDIEIADGLRVGEQVATNDLPRLDTGVKVNVVSAAAQSTPKTSQ